MESIYSLQQRADTLRQKTLVDSISPEEVGSLHADTLAYLADMEQNAEGLGIHKVYKSFAAMNADSSAPVGTNGKPLRFGQLVAVYDNDNQSQAENGNIYAFQKGAEAGWLLMGNLNSIGEVTAKIAAIKSDIAGLKDKDLEHDKALEKKANAADVDTKFAEEKKRVDAELVKKANAADVDTKFAEEKKRVDAELVKKANAADVDTKFTSEAARVNAELDKKANAEEVKQSFSEQTAKNTAQDAEITKKANAEDVNNSMQELDKKLNRNLLAIEFDDDTGELNAIIGQDSTIRSVSTDEDGNVIIEQEII